MYNLPRITKNLLLINSVLWLLTGLLGSSLYLDRLLGLYPPYGPFFHFWQPLTYMFMHGGFTHLFCNMFAVMMFGPALEREWGERRYLIYYLVCGLGAAAIEILIWYLTKANPYACTIGASGAVFGILFAFAWRFPDVEMYILFIPRPVRARTMVIGYAAIELLLGIGNLSGGLTDNIAHFAHLGGMLFGWLLLLIWRWYDHHGHSTQNNNYNGFHYQRSL